MYKNLTTEQKILLNLTAKSISTNSPKIIFKEEELKGADWQAVLREAKLQTVCPLTFSRIEEYKKYIPDNVYKEYKTFALSVVTNNYKVFNAQKELVNLVSDKCSYVIIKGLSSGVYYDVPELRTYGDVDFLINPEKKQELTRLLIENGYKMSNGDHPNHLVFKKPNAHLEMHFMVAGVPYGEKGEIVKSVLSSIFDQKTIREFDGERFSAPNDFMHGLILLLHMGHHLLGEGIGLRHLSDWGAFVECTKDEEFWQKDLLPLLDKIGLLTFAKIITKVCVNYLNISCPKFCASASDETASEIILDVFKSGNFGKKDKNRASSGMLISERGKDGLKHGATYNLAHSLHKAVLRKKAVKKCPILYPFIYVYKAIRFLVLSAFGKRPSLIKMAPEAKTRKEIYKKLKIFETNKGE